MSREGPVDTGTAPGEEAGGYPMEAVGWHRLDPEGIRRERHFGRDLLCFADRPATILQILSSTVARFGSSEALVAGGQRISYAALWERAGRIAGWLSEAGIKRGDRVAVLAGNHPSVVIIIAACLRLGGICVPLSHRLARPEIQLMLADSTASVLFVQDQLVDRLPESALLPELTIAIGDAGGLKLACSELERWLGSSPVDPEVSEEDCAFILYTSGTTGRPKGAMLTHLNIVHSIVHYQRCFRLKEAERTLIAVPVTHVTGLVGQLLAMWGCGGACILMDEFNAHEAIRLMSGEKITHSVMVPAMYALMLMRPELGTADLSSLKLGLFGGAPMPEDTIIGLKEKLPELNLSNGYGATETASPATLLPPAAIARHRMSVGLPVHCAQIRIVDNEDQLCPTGEAGEILIKGPMVVPGYWNLPEEAASQFTDEGFWRSGDIGRMSTEGYVEVLDRRKDMINRGGYKVYSSEVENHLLLHPGINEAAVIGRPCAVLGERVHAYILPVESAVAEKDMLELLTAWCVGCLADYKVPESVTLVTEPLPRNANGKTMKSALRRHLLSEMSTRLDNA